MEKGMNIEHYEPPEVETLFVDVELGYAESDTEGQLPTWGKEDGHWQ